MDLDYQYVCNGFDERGRTILKKIWKVRPPHMTRLQFFWYRFKALL
jgi:hypothetical protein